MRPRTKEEFKFRTWMASSNMINEAEFILSSRSLQCRGVYSEPIGTAKQSRERDGPLPFLECTQGEYHAQVWHGTGRRGGSGVVRRGGGKGGRKKDRFGQGAEGGHG